MVLQYRSLRAHQLRFIVRSVRRERRRTRDDLPSGFGRSHEDVRWFFAGEEDIVYRTFTNATESALPPMAEWDEEAVATFPEIADPHRPRRTPTLKRSRRRSFSPLPPRKKSKRLQQAVAADVSEEETDAMDVGEVGMSQSFFFIDGTSADGKISMCSPKTR